MSAVTQSPAASAWAAAGLAAFPFLFFVSAPYGKLARDGWGAPVDGRLGWFLQELPSPLALVRALTVHRDDDDPSSSCGAGRWTTDDGADVALRFVLQVRRAARYQVPGYHVRSGGRWLAASPLPPHASRLQHPAVADCTGKNSLPKPAAAPVAGAAEVPPFPHPGPRDHAEPRPRPRHAPARLLSPRPVHGVRR